MKLIVNCINLNSAGGLNVALNFLYKLKDKNNYEVVLLAPAKCGYEEFETHFKVIFFKSYLLNFVGRLFTDNILLPFLVRKYKAAVVFNMGNFAIPYIKVKQATLFMYPHVIYPEETEVKNRFNFSELLQTKLRNSVFLNRIVYSDMIFPQTEVAKIRLARIAQIKEEKFVVVPCAYTQIQSTTNQNHSFRFNRDKGEKYLLCLSRYYIHKNIEIFIQLGEELKAQKAPYKIIITLDTNQHHNVSQLLETIKQKQLEEYIINLGAIKIDDVPNLWNAVDAMILPTLLESFSATYIDSMHFRKPIFTSDRDFAREICGDMAYYFNPLDAVSIFNTIDKAYKTANDIEDKVNKAEKYSKQMPNWDKVADQYLENLEKMAL